MLTVTNENLDKFNVKVVRKGDRYGLNGCLEHKDADPLVEFYDAEFANKRGFDYRGQFVSRYYLSTLLTHLSCGCGLCLEGSVPKWGISSLNVQEAVQFANNYIME